MSPDEYARNSRRVPPSASSMVLVAERDSHRGGQA
jgi:hypothetical protein